MLGIDYFLTLILTIIIEVGVAILFGYRSYVAIRAVVLVNFISHPLINYLLWLDGYSGLVDYTTLLVVLEILVVFGEWGGIWLMLREDPKRLLVLSASMNVASFAAGLIWFSL